MNQIVLLGDSVFDNAAYVEPGPNVNSQLNALLPIGWSSTLLAVDGSVTDDVTSQADNVPAAATHIVLSTGGNDALGHQAFLSGSASSVASVLLELSQFTAHFRESYRALLSILGEINIPVTVCTIYDPSFSDPTYAQVASAALAGFNSVIVQEAAIASFDVLDLRLLFISPKDYAHEIEPSVVGGAKIASAVCDLTVRRDGMLPTRSRLWP